MNSCLRTTLYALLASLLVAFPVHLAAAEKPRTQPTGPSFDRLDPDRAWQVGSIELNGAERFSARALEKKLLTRERAWYTPWRARPDFDPATFTRDLERLARFYESEGYFQTRLHWDWQIEDDTRRSIIALRIDIDEGPRARVARVEVEVDAPLQPEPQSGAQPQPQEETPPFAEPLALQAGQPFREATYQRGQAQLLHHYLAHGHAEARVTRSARVRSDRLEVDASYRVEPAQIRHIESIEIQGTQDVDPSLVRRELSFEEGDIFSVDAFEVSRTRLLALRLFASIRIDWEVDPDPARGVHVTITVRERPPRELRVGVGYSTEELVRGQVRWQSDNWFGGGRRMRIGGRYSKLVRSADLAFAQPHFFDRHNRALLDASLAQEDERTYTRNFVQVVPSFERRLRSNLLLNVGLRLETDQIRDVEAVVTQRIGGVRDEGLLIGPTALLRWTPVDDVVDPKKGFITQARVSLSSRHLGASYDFYKATASVAGYYPWHDVAVLAARLKLGVADSIGSIERLPIFERFYAGGDQSVRGYQRRKLGPTASNGDPLGGRALIEGAVELRIPVWKDVGVVGFLDYGQVSLDRFDLVPNDLRFSAGPGLTYETPFGPLALFAGFPINGQPGEPSWQLHFSIGFFF